MGLDIYFVKRRWWGQWVQDGSDFEQVTTVYGVIRMTVVFNKLNDLAEIFASQQPAAAEVMAYIQKRIPENLKRFADYARFLNDAGATGRPKLGNPSEILPQIAPDDFDELSRSFVADFLLSDAPIMGPRLVYLRDYLGMMHGFLTTFIKKRPTEIPDMLGAFQEADEAVMLLHRFTIEAIKEKKCLFISC
jgi:hypothetical protein